MCELLGMSANTPTDLRFSFAGLMQRGGVTGPHRDGWGVAFYQDRGCRCFHDPTPSAESELARFLRAQPIKAKIAVSHIRRANRGKVCLENTHPFQREVWGRIWTYAHNGQLKGIKKLPLGRFRPVGTTDSEYAFCWLLARMTQDHQMAPPSPAKLRRLIFEGCRTLHEMGIYNMLLSDGHRLYCFRGSKLAWITRRAPFGRASLIDDEMAVDFAAETTPNDVVTVVATQPLTNDEVWTVLDRGAMLTLRDGEVEAIDRPSRKK